MSKCSKCGKDAGLGMSLCPECIAKIPDDQEMRRRQVTAATAAVGEPAHISGARRSYGEMQQWSTISIVLGIAGCLFCIVLGLQVKTADRDGFESMAIGGYVLWGWGLGILLSGFFWSSVCRAIAAILHVQVGDRQR